MKNERPTEQKVSNKMSDPKKELESQIAQGVQLAKGMLTRYAAIYNPLMQAAASLAETIKSAPKIRAGDVVGVSRGVYDHYGVYIGNDEVIHYWSDSSDKSFDNKIVKTSFDAFLRGSEEYFILDFPEKHDIPKKIKQRYGTSSLTSTIGRSLLPSPATLLLTYFKNKDYHLYSAEQTAQRAKSKLEVANYGLFLNNCEHFAIWCKTGVSESHQIQELIDMAKGLVICR